MRQRIQFRTLTVVFEGSAADAAQVLADAMAGALRTAGVELQHEPEPEPTTPNRRRRTKASR